MMQAHGSTTSLYAHLVQFDMISRQPGSPSRGLPSPCLVTPPVPPWAVSGLQTPFSVAEGSGGSAVAHMVGRDVDASGLAAAPRLARRRKKMIVATPSRTCERSRRAGGPQTHHPPLPTTSSRLHGHAHTHTIPAILPPSPHFAHARTRCFPAERRRSLRLLRRWSPKTPHRARVTM